MKSISPLILPVLIILFGSCNNRKIIMNQESRQEIEQAFNKTRKLAAARAEILFSPFDQELSNDELDALMFLYSGMPLSDLADYSGDFFLSNTRYSLLARYQYRWGNSIPGEIFLQYVLPVRVNNENLDSFRIKYYNELYTRVGSMKSMESAALEINRWCHEKVSYQPADIRTSAPESTILSARGRCGEESTFTVAALRTAGIPARQVYVPRWAHSDDNHAWVEVWIDGIWKYLGACEPEPVLNRGWFTEPASRSMLVHTKTYGLLPATEPLVKREEFYAEINNLHLYADTREINVVVIDKSGEAVPGAKVEFKLVNYAELYSLSTLVCDESGRCNFETGKGDLLVWASAGNKYGTAFSSQGNSDTLRITISENHHGGLTASYDFRAPAATKTNVVLTPEQESENRRLLAREDSIRNAYIASWQYEPYLPGLHNAGYDTMAVRKQLRRSEGNYRNIILFLEMAAPRFQADAIKLLEVIADKDLRDTEAGVLYDHLSLARRFDVSTIPEEVFVSYVLNPRIANEIITPWRSYIQEQQDDETIEAFRSDPSILVPWINENITIINQANYYRVPVSPRGVLELMVSDALSRDIFFVACCRSCGIPSRLAPGTGRAKYLNDKTWIDAGLSSDSGKLPKQGILQLLGGEKGDPEPRYFKQFTIARIINGSPETLDFSFDKPISDFMSPLSLEAGHYMLVTSNRVSDSLLLSSVRFFDINEDELIKIDVVTRTEEINNTKHGTIDPVSSLMVEGEKLAIGDLLDNGLVIAWIDPRSEPSRHLINELPGSAGEFDKWEGSILFLTADEKLDYELPGSGEGFPERILHGRDIDLNILNSVPGNEGENSHLMPVVILLNREGEIIFQSSGYSIGLPERVLRHIRSAGL